MCNKNYRVDKLHPFFEKHSDDIHLNKKEPLGLTLIIANKCSGLIFSSFMNKSLEVHVILIYY